MTTLFQPHRYNSMRHRGFTLIELMVAITLGMIIMAALLALYLNVSRTNNEMAKANRQIENGRFAIQLLQNDLVHAGFWGGVRPAAATGIPVPCPASADWDDAVFKANLLAIPVQGFTDGGAVADCGVSGVLADSDVLVVSHANTCVAGAPDCDDDGPNIQVSGCTTEAVPEAPYVIQSSGFTLRKKDCATIADRRKIVTNVYYLAQSNGQPTLMRVALTNGTFGTPEPLIEGIEAMRFEYGIDSLGKNGMPVSATNPGDGKPDGAYERCEPCSQTQLENIVAIKIHVLARNLEVTQGHTDSKTYQLGSTTVAASGDGYKRHVFSTTVRLVNPSGRREVP